MNKNYVIWMFIVTTVFQLFNNDFANSTESNKAWNDRMKLFKEMGKNMRQIKRAENTTIIAKSAAVIHANAQKVADLALWPKGSGGGDTRAKIEIWKNIKDFQQKFKSLEQTSLQLIKIAKTKDLDASKGAFTNMLRTCGSCHREYRAPKKW